jgi:hypothetical protein
VLGGGIGGVSVAQEPKQVVGNEDRTTLVSNKPFFQFTPFNPRVAIKWRSNAILVTGASPAGIEAGCGVANIVLTAALHTPLPQVKRVIVERRLRSAHFRYSPKATVCGQHAARRLVPMTTSGELPTPTAALAERSRHTALRIGDAFWIPRRECGPNWRWRIRPKAP